MKRFLNFPVRYLVYLVCGLGLLLAGSSTAVLADSPDAKRLYELADEAVRDKAFVNAAILLEAVIEVEPDATVKKKLRATLEDGLQETAKKQLDEFCSSDIPIAGVSIFYAAPPPPLPPYPDSPDTGAPSTPGDASTTACSGTPVIANFTAYPTTIGKGQSSVLQWGSITNAQGAYLMAEDTITGVATPAHQVVTPSQTTSYTLVAFCGDNAVRSDVTVQVRSSAALAEPRVISILEDEVQQVADGTPVELYSGWITDAPEQQSDFLASLNMVLTVDGEPLPVPMAFWGEIEETEDFDEDGDMDYLVPWRYPLDVLSRGTHRVVVEWSFQQPITDGFDSDGDGARDEFYEPREFSLEIVVGPNG